MTAEITTTTGTAVADRRYNKEQSHDRRLPFYKVLVVASSPAVGVAGLGNLSTAGSGADVAHNYRAEPSPISSERRYATQTHFTLVANRNWLAGFGRCYCGPYLAA